MTIDSKLVTTIKDGVEWIRRQFKEPDDDWAPIIMMKSKSGKVKIGLIELDEDRSLTAKVITGIVRESDAEEVVLLTSAWCICRDSDEEVHGEVSEQPDRQEVLVISHVTKDSAQLLMANIIRSNENPPKLGPWVESDTLGVGGLLTDALRKGVG